MKRSILTVGFICAFSFGAYSQSVRPSATPPPADEDVVKISTNLIQIDVTVTDRKGKIVTDLKPEEFEIFENGEKQTISNFSFISSVKEQSEVVKNQADKLAVPIPRAALRPDQIRRTIALVVDDLSLSFESAYYTRRGLKKFVDEQMQEGDLVAIIRTGAGIGALQQFTSDKRQLYAAIERVKWNPIGTGGVGAFAPIEPTLLELAKANGDTTVSEEDLEDERNRNNSISDFRSSIFVTGTLGALQYIVTGMGELPGRKSVILFSDGFRLLERDEHGFSGSGRVLEFLRQLVDVANRSSVVFYTIDARGLQTTGLTAQDDVIDASPQAIQAAISARSDELFETQAGLSYLAQETGGFAIKNNNDLSGGVRRILNDQSYYLIAYEPDTETFDPAKRKFNKLDVRVSRKDTNVRFRSGFFNVADEKIAKAPTTQTPLQQIQNALTSPFAINGISVRLNSLFGSDGMKNSNVRSLLHINAADLKFTDEPDGSKKAAFDVLAASFGDNGAIVDQIGRSYIIIAKGENLAKMLRDGFVYHFTFPVKKPGAYQYRVAIRDPNTSRVGSASQFIEIPNLKKQFLTASSLVLESLTDKQWQVFSSGNPIPPVGKDGTTVKPTDPMTDTSLRRFKLGTILRYGFEIYNAKLDAARKPSLEFKVRVFREGKVVLDGNQQQIGLLGQTSMTGIKAGGAINLGAAMGAGDFILQIIITDNLAKEKRKLATQFVQFEVVE